MSRFPIITTFITNQCSLHCPHCSIWCKDVCEINPHKWIEYMTALKDEFNPHIVILGGEPLEYGGNSENLVKLVKGLEGNDVSYSITSNSVLLKDKVAEQLVSVGLLNWTVSIDYPSTVNDMRSRAGYKAIKKFKKLGVKDLHSTVVIYKENLVYIASIIHELLDLGVWVEPTFAMWSKAPQYDSFPKSCKPEYTDGDLVLLSSICDYILDRYKSGDKIHISKNYLTENNIHDMVNANFKCPKLIVPTFNSLGKMVLCRDIGSQSPFTPTDLVEDWPFISKSWDSASDWLCKGCNWDCPYHVLDGMDNFKHGVR